MMNKRYIPINDPRLYACCSNATRKKFRERILELRNKAIAKGMQLLDEDDVLDEVKRRRDGT